MSFLQNLANNAVQFVTFETAFTPPLVFDRPLAQQQGAPNPFLSLIKPRVTINLGNYAQPQVFAPWGQPQANYWQEVQIGLIALAAIATYLIIKKGA